MVITYGIPDVIPSVDKFLRYFIIYSFYHCYGIPLILGASLSGRANTSAFPEPVSSLPRVHRAPTPYTTSTSRVSGLLQELTSSPLGFLFTHPVIQCSQNRRIVCCDLTNDRIQSETSQLV